MKRRDTSEVPLRVLNVLRLNIKAVVINAAGQMRSDMTGATSNVDHNLALLQRQVLVYCFNAC